MRPYLKLTESVVTSTSTKVSESFPHPSAAALKLMRCSTCRDGLAREGSSVTCAGCGDRRPIENGVVRFLADIDPFYEGAYARQIRYLPNGSAKDWAFFHLVQSGVLGHVKAALPKHGRVLDLGCAGGIRWLGRDALTIGVDLSVESLRLAATTYAAALQASVLNLPIVDGEVDIVYGSYIFEHLTSEQKRACLDEVRRVLKPGGVVVLQFDTLSNNALTRFALHDPHAFKRAFVDNDGHIGLAPLSETLAHFEEAGLRVQTRTCFGTTPLQYAPTYHWLDAAYGDRFLWVRGLGAIASTLSRSPLGIPYEFAVTAMDRLLSRFADPDDATRAIVVAHNE